MRIAFADVQDIVAARQLEIYFKRALRHTDGKPARISWFRVMDISALFATKTVQDILSQKGFTIECYIEWCTVPIIRGTTKPFGGIVKRLIRRYIPLPNHIIYVSYQDTSTP